MWFASQFWVGALLPLIASLNAGTGAALARFSRLIPYPLAALVASGGVLAVVQLDRVDALWTTNYGIVLSCKLAAVIALLALAAANRYVSAPRYQGGDAIASTTLTRTMAAELCIVAAILALVALWRFTPPPRALAASEPVEVHLHGERAMAQVSLLPVRARDPRVGIEVLDGAVQCARRQGSDGDARQSRGRDRAGAARGGACRRRALAGGRIADSGGRAMDRACRFADRRFRQDRA